VIHMPYTVQLVHYVAEDSSMEMTPYILVDHQAATIAETRRTGFARPATSWKTVDPYLAGHSIHLISRQQEEPEQHFAAYWGGSEEIDGC
jgi:hypothetical protein